MDWNKRRFERLRGAPERTMKPVSPDLLTKQKKTVYIWIFPGLIFSQRDVLLISVEFITLDYL